MTTFSEDHTLWMLGRSGVERTCELGLLTEKFAQMLLVVIPVGNFPAGYATVHGSLGHGSTDLCDKSWVNRFRNEVLRSEGEVIDMINLIYDVGHWFLSKLCDSFRCSHFHLLVDGRGMHIERTTEDIREANDIVYLVRLVGTPRRHEYVRSCGHCILIAYLRHWVCKGKHDRIGSHGADHVLSEDITFGQTDKDVSSLYGLL